MKGKFIVIEGCDSVGKHTQSTLLVEYLKRKNIPVVNLSFPNYGSLQATPVEMYLNGKMPDLCPIETAMLYAFDRSVTIKEKNIKSILENGTWVIADRYVESNMIYMASKLNKEKSIITKKIKSLEYDILELPKPDIQFYLHMDTKLNHQLLADRDGKKDIHELNLEYLKRCSEIGYAIAQEEDNIIITCDNDSHDEVLSIGEIHSKIIKHLECVVTKS